MYKLNIRVEVCLWVLRFEKLLNKIKRLINKKVIVNYFRNFGKGIK